MAEDKDCEVCGAENARNIAIIEAVSMRVCDKCSKYGKVISIEKGEISAKKSSTQKDIEVEEEIVEDYAERIKSAREKRGMTRTELASLIDERESFIKRVEAGDAVPDDRLALKLQKVFGIKLYEAVEIEAQSKSASKGKGNEITFGDVIEIKKKKK